MTRGILKSISTVFFASAPDSARCQQLVRRVSSAALQLAASSDERRGGGGRNGRREGGGRKGGREEERETRRDRGRIGRLNETFNPRLTQAV